MHTRPIPATCAVVSMGDTIGVPGDRPDTAPLSLAKS